MEQEEDNAILRARDFWGALVLLALSVFFLWKTSAIPLFGGNRAGVSGASWYNSAAIVPLGIFGALLILSIVPRVIAIKAGGAARALIRSASAGTRTKPCGSRPSASSCFSM